MKSEDGGAAFSRPEIKTGIRDDKFPGGGYISTEGAIAGNLTVRDYFAGQALAGYFSGLLANSETFLPDLKADQASKVCYAIASAMLEERKRREEGK